MASDAKETAKQENGSRVYFELIIESNKDPDKDFVELSNAVKKVYPDVSNDWMESFKKQALALKKYLGNNNKYNYSRDKGFMPFIENIAKKKCGVTVKDRWNPADIYMIKSTQESAVMKKLDEITDSNDKDANLLSLNSYMRELMNDKIMIPVSLKAIAVKTKDAKAESANLDKSKGPGHEFKLKSNSLKCILSMGHKNAYEFDTGEFAFDFYVGEEEIHGQARNFQYSKARNLIQTDLTPKGRSGGAKLGKVSSTALDDFLKNNGLERPSSAAKDPNIDPPGQWSEKNIHYWINFIKEIQQLSVAGNKIDLGDLRVKTSTGEEEGPEAVIKNAILWEDKTRSSAGRFSSKLIGLRWAKVWSDIDNKGKLDSWLKTLYYGAKKEFGEKNGPFLKIY
jgi:hypothetical protein